MLSDWLTTRVNFRQGPRLNAPYGARCFLTGVVGIPQNIVKKRLNAPYGARCFLTKYITLTPHEKRVVLMHLMALGAF